VIPMRRIPRDSHPFTGVRPASFRTLVSQLRREVCRPPQPGRPWSLAVWRPASCCCDLLGRHHNMHGLAPDRPRMICGESGASQRLTQGSCLATTRHDALPAPPRTRRSASETVVPDRVTGHANGAAHLRRKHAIAAQSQELRYDSPPNHQVVIDAEQRTALVVDGRRIAAVPDRHTPKGGAESGDERPLSGAPPLFAGRRLHRATGPDHPAPQAGRGRTVR